MSVDPSDTGRISVSRDALRAELAGLELRLVEKLASKGEVDELRKEVDGLGGDVNSLKRWRAYAAGVATAAVALSGLTLAVVLNAIG